MVGIGSVGLVIYFCAIQPAVVRDGLEDKRFHYKEVGQWLNVYSMPDEVVMSRGAITAIYADRHWVPFPHTEYQDLLRYARAHDVNYLVINSDSFEMMRPQLAFLMDRKQLPEELEWMHTHENGAGSTVVLRLVD